LLGQGQIPKEIGNLVLLRDFQVNHNQLEGKKITGITSDGHAL
jgi:hypothetical protein